MLTGGRMKTSAGVVVVGAGVIGCAITYELSIRGVDVLLLEKDSIGSGGSAHATGSLNLLGSEFKPGASFLQGIQSYKLFPDLVSALEQETGMDLLYQRRPQIRLALESKEETLLKESLAWQKQYLEMEWIDGDQVRNIEPRISTAVRGALYEPETSQLDSYRFTLAMAQAAEKNGAEIQNREVTGLIKDKGIVTHVKHSSGIVPCDAVIFTMGPWAVDCAEWLGIPVPVVPLKGERLLLRYHGAPLPVLITSPKRGHMINRLDGLISVGSTGGRDYDKSELFLGTEFDRHPTESARIDLLSRAIEVMPDLETAEVVEHVAGSRPLSSDTNPILGPVPGLQGAFLATGHGTKGIHLAPVTAKIIGDYITQGKYEPNDHGSSEWNKTFSPERFSVVNHEDFNEASLEVDE